MTVASLLSGADRSNARDAALSLLVIGGLWELAVRVFRIKPYLLPPPSTVLREAWHSAALLWSQTLVTLWEVLAGFAVAVILGVVLAVLIHFLPVARRTLYPVVVALQSIPKVGLAPVMVVWLGYGLASKVTMAALFALFPVVIATLGGFAGVPANLEEHFHALNASSWVMFRRLTMPAALPNFVDGCKVAMPMAVIGAIVGEFVGSNDGLGNLILAATGSSRTPLTFAALLAVTALSLILFGVIELMGRLVWWRRM
jgi:NitT/TauT family transport system permease protein